MFHHTQHGHRGCDWIQCDSETVHSILFYSFIFLPISDICVRHCYYVGACGRDRCQWNGCVWLIFIGISIKMKEILTRVSLQIIIIEPTHSSSSSTHRLTARNFGSTADTGWSYYLHSLPSHESHVSRAHTNKWVYCAVLCSSITSSVCSRRRLSAIFNPFQFEVKSLSIIVYWVSVWWAWCPAIQYGVI